MQALLDRIAKRLRKRRAKPAAQEDATYQERLRREREAFDQYIQVHDLPDIFHYWSNAYLAPKLRRFGISDPEQFFFLYVQKHWQAVGQRPLRLLSLGAGNCDMEARLARRLLDSGISDFSLECIDINSSMLERGREHARSLGVDAQLTLTCADFNDWKPAPASQDIIIANQCLHHVLELESLFDAIRTALRPDGYFLTSDMIGRNGHQRWPEALELVQEFWKELPPSYRYNQLLRRQEDTYINHDCSTEGFEGIRAQDILPLLVQHFHFELFIPFGNLIFVFIDRPFGHNFDAQADWDRNFIDRVHAADEAAMLEGRIKPTQILAALRCQPVEPRLLDARLTPEFCIRPVS